jgi:hypothetical protein
MQFRLAFLLPIVALASHASAAECYTQDGSNRCVDSGSIWPDREDYCNNNWQRDGNSEAYPANNGFSARFTRTGTFASQEQCWDFTHDIINTCFGRKDGGTWTGSSMEMNINFCT